MVLGSTIKQTSKDRAQNASQESFLTSKSDLFSDESSFIPQNPPEPLIMGNLKIHRINLFKLLLQ